jgi:hypothetical protein
MRRDRAGSSARGGGSVEGDDALSHPDHALAQLRQSERVNPTLLRPSAAVAPVNQMELAAPPHRLLNRSQVRKGFRRAAAPTRHVNVYAPARVLGVGARRGGERGHQLDVRGVRCLSEVQVGAQARGPVGNK